jgi:hypothetical protein
MRPSTLRRSENLLRLLGEFETRDLGPLGVALVLGCSASAARNYIAELLDARVIRRLPGGPGDGCADRVVYGVDQDAQRVARFKAALAGSMMGGDSGPQWRDPLVAALFGTSAA